MRKTYEIARVQPGFQNWDAILEAPICCAPWQGWARVPACGGKLVFEEGFGFRLRLFCREQDPKITWKNPNEPVYQDSCLEFFCDYAPEAGKGYVNCEMNAAGTLLCAIGPDGDHRTFLRDLGLTPPAVQPFQTPEGWGCLISIPISLLEALYGPCTWEPGKKLRGNFYKCGDCTAVPHFGCWSPIDFPQPSFHQPSQFGELILG